jgi:hypothetical protein
MNSLIFGKKSTSPDWMQCSLKYDNINGLVV